MTTTNIKQANTNNLSRQNKSPRIIKKVAFALLKVIILVFILVLSMSYESGNPKIGTHPVEYYISPMQSIIRKWVHNKLEKDKTKNYNFYLNYLTSKFYETNDYIPVWTMNFTPNENAIQAFDLMKNGNKYGFYPELFNVNEIEELQKKMNCCKDLNSRLKIRTRYEIEMTESMFSFMIHLNKGFRSFDTTAYYLEFGEDLPGYLINALKTGEFSNNILSLQPENYQYTLLQKALDNYIGSSRISKFYIEIPELNSDSVKRNIIAEKILLDLGYLHADDTINGEIFADAVRTLQTDNNVEPTGIINNKTIKILEKSYYYGFMKIALNLDRLRKIESGSDHYAYVNIPSFKLKVVKNNAVEKEFKVIVGKTHSPTPELSSRIENIIANPYWNVPYSITVNEIIPRIKKDSNYLKRNRMELVNKYGEPVDQNNIDLANIDFKNYEYKFRQDASRSNALGIIKFSFPNPYNVYIHDTPGKRLFSKEVRAFSHGCVRLNDPDKFAEYLILNNCDREDIDIHKILKSGEHENIKLSVPLDITIGYFTCEADDNLNIRFLKDIYKKDDKVIKELFGISI